MKESSGINLIYTTMRGIVLMSGERPPRDQKDERKMAFYGIGRVAQPPKILILDSKGFIRIYHYLDARFLVSALSMQICHLSIDEFNMKKMRLREKLLPKKKNRSKSQLQKSKNLVPEKGRSKSQDASSQEVKIT